MNQTVLQATCGGYTGDPVTVIAAWHDAQGLMVGKVSKVMRGRGAPNVSVVSNLTVDAWDAWFSDEVMQDAIDLYRQMQADGRLRFHPDAMRADPTMVIQIRKIEERGRKYELLPETTNAQVATLMLCWFAHSISGVEKSMQVIDSLLDDPIWTV